MIDIRLIREQREEMEKRLRTRDASIDLGEVLSADARPLPSAGPLHLANPLNRLVCVGLGSPADAAMRDLS